jgi:hypothetical protein
MLKPYSMLLALLMVGPAGCSSTAIPDVADNIRKSLDEPTSRMFP